MTNILIDHQLVDFSNSFIFVKSIANFNRMTNTRLEHRLVDLIN